MGNKREKIHGGWTVVNRIDGTELSAPTRETAVSLLKMIMMEHGDGTAFDFDERRKTVTIFLTSK